MDISKTPSRNIDPYVSDATAEPRTSAIDKVSRGRTPPTLSRNRTKNNRSASNRSRNWLNSAKRIRTRDKLAMGNCIASRPKIHNIVERRWSMDRLVRTRVKIASGNARVHCIRNIVRRIVRNTARTKWTYRIVKARRPVRRVYRESAYTCSVEYNRAPVRKSPLNGRATNWSTVRENPRIIGRPNLSRRNTASECYWNISEYIDPSVGGNPLANSSGSP